MAITYRLSNLLRGRQGTEWAIDGHDIGDRFILLNGDIGTIDMATDLIGREFYKPVTIGKSLASTAEQSFAYQANSLKAFSPVHIAGSRMYQVIDDYLDQAKSIVEWLA